MLLLHKAHDNGTTANVIKLSAAISACEKGGQWEQALVLLDPNKDGAFEKTSRTFISIQMGTFLVMQMRSFVVVLMRTCLVI